MKTLLFPLIPAFLLVSCTPGSDRDSGELFSAEGKAISVFTTADSSNLRLSPTGTLRFEASRQPLETEIFVYVNPSCNFQSFLGIGGAITDASAEVFATLPEAKQQELLEAYFDTGKGIGYSLARTTIHSSDFSSASYTYVKEGDAALETFDISHDREFRIPLLRKALESAGGKLVVYASPWSPPAFMKDNNNMLRGGKLLPEFNKSWADYFIRFIQAYEKEGIPIWGVTVQNEPMATQRWESCIYTAEEERDFLKNHLGPAFRTAGMGDKKIIVWDHNRDLITHRAGVIFEDPEAARYAWGMGFHWYEPWSGGQPMYDNVAEVHRSYPDVNLLFTEGCADSYDPGRLFYWPNAEKYGSSMIHDFNNGACGWTDWNILLDMQGGPNHVGNFCFAPVHADTRSGELVFTPSFYYIGHFSKFIRPGAVRVSATPSRSGLITTSFLNADGKMATIVMNQGDREVVYNLIVGSFMSPVTIPARAIQTLVY